MQGGGYRFVRYNCTVEEALIGHALMYPGRITHWHESLAITRGTRYIVISVIETWIASSSERTTLTADLFLFGSGACCLVLWQHCLSVVFDPEPLTCMQCSFSALGCTDGTYYRLQWKLGRGTQTMPASLLPKTRLFTSNWNIWKLRIWNASLVPPWYLYMCTPVHAIWILGSVPHCLTSL